MTAPSCASCRVPSSGCRTAGCTGSPPPGHTKQWRFVYGPNNLVLVIKTWRGKNPPRYVEPPPGARGVALAMGEPGRSVYVGLPGPKDLLYVTATREEPTARDVGVNG